MVTKGIDRFLSLVVEMGASDLHYSVGHPPIYRILGELEPLRFMTITQDEFNENIGSITPEQLYGRFLETGDCDFAYDMDENVRFRVNLYKHEHGCGAAFRIIPREIYSFEQLGLPPQVAKFCDYDRGLVLVTGPTGSGKSTTLASIVNKLNLEKSLHILTIEDPIEFVHVNIKSVITQRELGQSTQSFSEALKAAVREAPDVILVGEMRDLETMQMALHAAETGLLVFATMHTNSASRTVDRLVNVFPTDEQPVVRNVLSGTLRGILAQQLIQTKNGDRVPAVEILFGSTALGNLLKEGKTSQIDTMIVTGKRQGMVLMDESLMNLVREGLVEPRQAYEKSISKESFRKRLMDEMGIRVLKEEEEIGLK